MKKLLIITAHSKKEGTAQILADAFELGIDQTKYKIEHLNAYNLNLPICEGDLEDGSLPDSVKDFQKKWTEADVLAFFMPNWWGISPAPLADIMNWVTNKIAIFAGGKPKPLMTGKKVIWVTTGAAPKIFRKFLFKINPEIWGKYIFSFSGAKFKSYYFDRALTGQGKNHLAWEAKMKKVGEGLNGD